MRRPECPERRGCGLSPAVLGFADSPRARSPPLRTPRFSAGPARDPLDAARRASRLRLRVPAQGGPVQPTAVVQ